MQALQKQGPLFDLGVQCTPRQKEVLALAAAGLTDKLIARRMGLSVCTVRSYWQRLFAQNCIHTRTEAVAVWLGYRP